MMKVDTEYRYSYYGNTTYEGSYILQKYAHRNYNFDFVDDWDMEILAEYCAKDFYHNHDGWEIGSWSDGNEPITLYIWLDENTKVEYDVYLEYEPSFSAHKKEQNEKPI